MPGEKAKLEVDGNEKGSVSFEEAAEEHKLRASSGMPTSAEPLALAGVAANSADARRALEDLGFFVNTHDDSGCIDGGQEQGIALARYVAWLERVREAAIGVRWSWNASSTQTASEGMFEAMDDLCKVLEEKP